MLLLFLLFALIFHFLQLMKTICMYLITIYYNENEHTSKVSIKKMSIKKLFSFFIKIESRKDNK